MGTEAAVAGAAARAMSHILSALVLPFSHGGVRFLSRRFTTRRELLPQLQRDGDDDDDASKLFQFVLDSPNRGAQVMDRVSLQTKVPGRSGDDLDTATDERERRYQTGDAQRSNDASGEHEGRRTMTTQLTLRITASAQLRGRSYWTDDRVNAKGAGECRSDGHRSTQQASRHGSQQRSGG